ncbi:hypothetical protein GW17_00012251 [Ensete ventricosum]|nr:hypothetical protein GW17_00012251 [Ensete ventricosum]
MRHRLILPSPHTGRRGNVVPFSFLASSPHAGRRKPTGEESPVGDGPRGEPRMISSFCNLNIMRVRGRGGGKKREGDGTEKDRRLKEERRRWRRSRGDNMGEMWQGGMASVKEGEMRRPRREECSKGEKGRGRWTEPAGGASLKHAAWRLSEVFGPRFASLEHLGERLL